MQILGLLGMYFDAVVVEVEKYLLFSDWLWPYCVCKKSKVFIFDPSSPQQNKIYLFHSHIINRYVSETYNFEFLVGQTGYRKRKFLDKSQK